MKYIKPLYKEIEFVCYNTDFNGAPIESYENLYNEFKKIEKSKHSIKPYMQDFSEGDKKQLSLAVIILDKENESYYEKLCIKMAKRYNIGLDLYNYRTDDVVDSIIRGDYYDNIKI